ncbi:hypothetical protein [Paracoccus liaowanqingii]|uniref:hypothetical protein n=1 Tax=Paracoccus liaowanqingii TaxID=2560053 RepID=UPI00143DCF1A|nr:hypothetical protein [Paracoccus liaowanqingii]
MTRLILAAVLFPSLALAHPGHHDAVSWTHLLVHGDHLATIAMIAALGVAAWAILRNRP